MRQVHDQPHTVDRLVTLSFSLTPVTGTLPPAWPGSSRWEARASRRPSESRRPVRSRSYGSSCARHSGRPGPERGVAPGPGRSPWGGACGFVAQASGPAAPGTSTGWWPPHPVPAGWGLLSWPERPISLSLLDSLDLMARCSCDASTPPASPSECGPQWTELGGGCSSCVPWWGAWCDRNSRVRSRPQP